MEIGVALKGVIMFKFWKKSVGSELKRDLETKIYVTWPEGTEHYSDGPIWDNSFKDISKLSIAEKLLVESWEKYIGDTNNLSSKEKRNLKNLAINKLSKPHISTDVLSIVLEFLN
jgi:hypothetical protein